jgi:hypothetical protein
MTRLKTKGSPIIGLLLILLTSILVGVFLFIKQKMNTQVASKTYTSPLEKISFKYPPSWKGVVSQFPLPIESLRADAFTLTSPSGKVTISWVGAITGLGGGCDSNMPIGPNNQGCGLLEVVEKDKLPNADLYFVEWIYTTDGINYTPRFAIQSPDGYLNTTRTYLYTNVFSFKGKNNYMYLEDGRKIGPFESVLTGGGIFQRENDNYFPTTSKEEAKKFFSDPEMLQAKQILLSLSY